MQAKQVQFNFQPGVEKAEVIIREVNEVNELPVKAPIKLSIHGTISAPFVFLEKRLDQQDQVNQKRSHILVDRDKINISLVINENDEYTRGKVTGQLEFNPKFLQFGINTGKVWSPNELGVFFKMNRSFFEDRAENMRLVNELMNFTATVNSKIERSMKESGDRTDNFAQVVNSNLPPSFKLVIPIFKGTGSEKIEVETFAKIDGREVAFTLLSPGAQTIMEDLRNTVIDTQLDLIRQICPDIAIIEI